MSRAIDAGPNSEHTPPASVQKLSRYGSPLTIAVASLWPLYVMWMCRDYLNDDAYISITYAKCLVEGSGFVFNHPPASLGTTTPLFTLLIAAAGSVVRGYDLAHVAVLLSALCWIGTAWAVYGFRIAFCLSQRQATLIAVVILLAGWWSLGAETYLFQLLLVISAGLFFRGAWLLCGISTGLLYLTRGEGILVSGIFAAILLLRFAQTTEYTLAFRKKADSMTRGILSRFQPEIPPAHQMDLNRIVRAGGFFALGFLVPAIPWALYAYVTFGHVLPDTLQVKIAQGETGMIPTFTERLPFWMRWWWHRADFEYLQQLYWLLALLGACGIMLRTRPWGFFLLWAAAYAAGYAFLGVGAYYWYQYPIYAVWITCVALGLDAAIGLLYAWSRNRPRFIYPAHAAVFLLVALVFGFHLDVRPLWPYANQDDRGTTYRATAEWLRANTTPGERVAAGEVGYMAYYSQNQIIDLCGLTSPDITPYVVKGDYLSGFEMHEPRYYVGRDSFPWWHDLSSSQFFQDNYRHVIDIQASGSAIKVSVYKHLD